jgi:hypothetical protein
VGNGVKSEEDEMAKVSRNSKNSKKTTAKQHNAVRFARWFNADQLFALDFLLCLY